MHKKLEMLFFKWCFLKENNDNKEADTLNEGASVQFVVLQKNLRQNVQNNLDNAKIEGGFFFASEMPFYLFEYTLWLYLSFFA